MEPFCNVKPDKFVKGLLSPTLAFSTTPLPDRVRVSLPTRLFIVGRSAAIAVAEPLYCLEPPLKLTTLLLTVKL